VQTAADTFRANPKINTAQAIMELGVGEALLSCLDEKGQPQVVERAFIVPPRSQLGPISPQQRQQLMADSLVAGVYEKVVDRESAYEKLTQVVQAAPPPTAPAESSGGGFWGRIFGGGGATTPAPAPAPTPRATRGPGRPPDSIGTMIAKTAARSMTTVVVGTIARGVLGSLFGGGRRRR
jgi:hypothetical protein